MAENNSNNTKKRKTSTPIDTTYGHLQPQATDIERAVLGALMIDKDAFSMISDGSQTPAANTVLPSLRLNCIFSTVFSIINFCF